MLHPRYWPDSLPKPCEPVRVEVLLPVYRNFGQRCIHCEAVAVKTDQGQQAPVILLEFQRVEVRQVARAAAAASSASVM